MAQCKQTGCLSSRRTWRNPRNGCQGSEGLHLAPNSGERSDVIRRMRKSGESSPPIFKCIAKRDKAQTDDGLPWGITPRKAAALVGHAVSFSVKVPLSLPEIKPPPLTIHPSIQPPSISLIFPPLSLTPPWAMMNKERRLKALPPHSLSQVRGRERRQVAIRIAAWRRSKSKRSLL